MWELPQFLKQEVMFAYSLKTMSILTDSNTVVSKHYLPPLGGEAV